MSTTSRYQKLFEESIDSIALMDSELKLIEVNESFRNNFEVSATGSSFQDFFAEASLYDEFANLLKENYNVEEFETILESGEGLKKICLINCVRIVEEEQDIYLAVIRDNTRRKNAEQELLKAEKLSMTGKIARSIAHEIRNPLTNLTLALEQLKDEIPDDVDADLYFDIIKRNAERINTLITELLNSSKPKALKLELMSLNEVVNSAIELVKDRLNLKDMELQLDLDQSIPSLQIDKDQLQTAILNLLINAIEAMKEGQGVLKISTWQDDYVYLQIADNGKGISEEHMKMLFEPFFSGKRKGTGLGLLSVQNILHSHNAKIEVTSEVGVKTVFTIQFKSEM
ncbi:two-component system sensor histidine kinase NtrB [Fulvivirga lutea]|uniref:histidine kinase n=1 Tax=Fulvivirga lutea TaxID=2810512 RepID=A0A975A0H4_9BACT|nr:ATP-binding protein [Fulvivirga lutea]QSE97404.1 PAS domain S-box protein [Fulvivirga lutea]